MRAKLLGIPLIIVGIILLALATTLSIKIAFATLLIGLFTIFTITEKTTPTTLSHAHIKGSLNSIRTIIDELNLKGNSIYLPTSSLRTEERIFIPLEKTTDALPEIDTDLVFATGSDGTSLGLALPPAGLPLLNEIQKDNPFPTATLDTIEEHLQRFIGHNLLQSLSLTKQKDNSWKLELTSPLFCTHNTTFCTQYPCPTCSAILTAITRSTQKKLSVTNAENAGKKTTIYFKAEG